MSAKKHFWSRPEGITGILITGGLVVGAIAVADTMLPRLAELLRTTGGMVGGLALLTGIVYAIIDPKLRNLVWYAYKSVMRWITGIFVQIDPLSILKSYIEALEKQLKQMSKQIGSLRGQIRQLKSTFESNLAEIKKNMQIADKAQREGDDRNLALATRKAGRLQEVNAKYEVLLNKMDILYRMLTRMYENSEIMLEDTRDQVTLREQEYKAIRASHSAIRSAMNIISGDPDQRALFDQATEALADEVSAKVGEMERFMDTSKNLMASIDLQNGVFEEGGMRLLEQWESEGFLLAPSKQKSHSTEQNLDLNAKRPQILKEEKGNEYNDLFN